jgi:hypothetical protein
MLDEASINLNCQGITDWVSIFYCGLNFEQHTEGVKITKPAVGASILNNLSGLS